MATASTNSGAELKNQATEATIALDDLQTRIKQLETAEAEGQADSVKLKAEEKKSLAKSIKKETKEVAKKLAEIANEAERYEKLLEIHTALIADAKENSYLNAAYKRKQEELVKERNQARTELTKSTAVKLKLEGLCRELNKKNREYQEESKKIAQNELLKRNELSVKFQTTIEEVQERMNTESQNTSKIAQQNEDLSSKLKSFVEQYEVREQHFEKVLKTKDLEIKLAEAKFNQQKEIAEHCERRLALLEEQNKASSSEEEFLRQQVAMYNQKFEQFQGTLTQSNEMFTSFKADMEKLSAANKKLSKESLQWRTRWQKTNQTLIEVLDSKNEQDKTIELYKAKVEKLEKLCRALHGAKNASEGQKKTTEEAEKVEADDASSKTETV